MDTLFLLDQETTSAVITQLALCCRPFTTTFRGLRYKLDLVREPIEAIEVVEAHDLTVYGLMGTSSIPCLSLSEQIAQYVHAISLPAVGGKRPSRARNIVDIYVFDQYVSCDDGEVLDATIKLFDRRATHPFPPVIDIPEAWIAELHTIAAELELDLDGTGLVRFFSTFIARILGVPVSMNYEYRFLVLSALPETSPVSSRAQSRMIRPWTSSAA